MDFTRRNLLKGAGAGGAMAVLLAAGLLKPSRVLAAEWNRNAFEAKTLADALKAIGGGGTESKDVQLKVPDIAENGAVVPVEITANLPNVQNISILVDKNPFPLAASFDFAAGVMPYVRVPLKLGETSNVRVLVKADGKTYSTAKEVKVTIGGCGG